MYVTKIEPETNTVVLGEVDDLLRNGMTVGKLNWQKYDSAPIGTELTAQIRYNDPGVLSKISPFDDERISVEFMANVRGIAPGQSAVFYEGDDIVGGGIIQGSLGF
jgi:tRNA-specific 2-thiouridylase